MGGRWLRCRAGCRDRKEPPTDSATWFAGGIDRREEHRSHNPRQAHETLCVHDARAIGDDWHHTGVATILGVKFSGFLAWLMWRTIYLLKLPRLPKKLRVVTGWTLDLLFSRGLEQMLTMRDVEAMSQMAGRVRKLVAEGSTTTSLTERRSTPVFLEARRTPEEELA